MVYIFWYYSCFLLAFGASLYSRAATNSCQVDSSWWTGLVEICNCEDLNDPECSLSLTDTPTSAMSCKVDSEQQCKDHIFKLAYEYKSSPFANTCQYEDPNYKIAQDLATTCEDGYFRWTSLSILECVVQRNNE